LRSARGEWREHDAGQFSAHSSINGGQGGAAPVTDIKSDAVR